MYGVVTRSEAELDWAEFDRGFYEVKSVSGRAREPVEGATNTLSCFGDTGAVAGDPSLAAVDGAGRKATADHPAFDWASVCPTREAYREGLLETIGDCAATAPDVRLDDVGFPRGEFCRCDACEARFAASEHDDWRAWRVATVTEFVAAARERVPGRLSVALHPDPYPGHLHERSGIDLAAIADMVEEFVVPLYDPEYTTTYWLETIAAGFADRLDTAFAVELYAPAAVDALVEATAAVSEYADAVYFGYDAANASAAIRRIEAEKREGRSHG